MALANTHVAEFDTLAALNTFIQNDSGIASVITVTFGTYGRVSRYILVYTTS